MAWPSYSLGPGCKLAFVAEYDVQLSAVVNQLHAEGKDPSLAKQAFDDAVSDLVHRGGVSLDAGTFYPAAARYALAKYSDMGAAQTIDGLVQGALNPTSKPGDVMSAAGGLMVTAAIAGGAMTAGVGAAIVGGLAIAGTLLNEVFGGTSGPQTSMCGVTVSNPLPCAVGPCMLSNVCLEEMGKRVSDPGANELWRLFPDARRSEDAPWFRDPGSGMFKFLEFDWRGAHWNNVGGMKGTKALESMFGPDVWKVIALDGGQVPLRTVPQDFFRAFLEAYKKNKEFALNGLKTPLADWQVLLETALAWNRAHEKGAGTSISPNAVAPFGAWVWQARASNPGATPGGVIPVNTGARKSFVTSVRIGIGQKAPPKVPPPVVAVKSPSKVPAVLGAGAGAAAAFFLLGAGPFGAIAMAGAALGAVLGKTIGSRSR